MHFNFKIWHLVATILMIFLRINWPRLNLEARTLRSCIRLPHHFNTICPRPKNGTFGVPGRPRRGRGTMRPRYGTSREIRDGWQPYGSKIQVLTLVDLMTKFTDKTKILFLNYRATTKFALTSRYPLVVLSVTVAWGMGVKKFRRTVGELKLGYGSPCVMIIS